MKRRLMKGIMYQKNISPGNFSFEDVKKNNGIFNSPKECRNINIMTLNAIAKQRFRLCFEIFIFMKQIKVDRAPLMKQSHAFT